MTLRALLGMYTAATSLSLWIGSLAYAESLQEKLEGLYDATASVEIAPTTTGCEELKRRLAESQSYSQPYVTVDQTEVMELLTDLAECETDESEGEESSD